MTTKENETEINAPKYVRKFEILHRKYLGPDLDPKITSQKPLKEPLTSKRPIYLDSKGNLYDINYCKLDPKTLEVDPESWELGLQEEKNTNQNEITMETDQDLKLSQEELINKYTPKNPETILPFPQPEQFESFNDFEQAILDWKKITEKGLGFLQIPKPMGRSFSRPYFGGTTSNTTDQKSDGRTSVSSVGSINESFRGSMESRGSRGSIGSRSSITEKIFDKNDSDSSPTTSRKSDPRSQMNFNHKEMPKTMPGTNLLMIENDIWENQLIPVEPDPLFYDSIEEYEIAYLKWGEVVLNTTKKLPPHPSQFVQMYGLKTALEKEKKEQERIGKEKARLFKESIKKKKKTTTVTGTNNHFIWLQQLERELKSSMSVSGIEALDDLMLRTYGKTYRTILGEKEKQKQKQKQEKKEQLKKKKDNSNTDLMLQLSFNREQATKLGTMFENENYGLKGKELFKNLDRKVQNNLDDGIDKLVKIIKQNESYYLSQTKPLIGKFKGRLPKDTVIQSGRKKKKNEGSSRDDIVSTSLSNFSLRRTDLTGPMIAKSMDCPNEIKKKQVIFSLLDYQTNDPIKLKKLKNEKGIVKKLKSEIQKITYNNRLEGFEARCNPKIFLTKFIQEQKKEIYKIVTEAENLSIPHIKQILSNEMLLDTFNDTLNEFFYYENKEVSYLQLFLQLINPDNFHQLLDLYMESSTLLTHSKLASFVCEALQSNSFKEILEKYIQEQNIKYLYLISHSINFFSEMPISIFPYQPEISELIKHILNNDISTIEKNIFVHYYMNIISKSIQKSDSSMAYVSVSNQIQQMLNKIKQSFAKICDEHETFLSESIYKGISCRSSKVSAYFTFMLIYLLKIDDKKLLDLLLSPKTGLIQNIRKLSTTKFQHVRFACSQFFQIMKENEVWSKHIFETSVFDKNIILNDLSPPPKPKRLDEDEKIQPPFIATLIHNFIIGSLNKINIYKDNDDDEDQRKKKKKNNDAFQYMLQPNLFFVLLDHLEKLCNEKFSNQTLELISSIIAKFITIFSKLNRIEYGKVNTVTKNMKASKKSRVVIDLNLVKQIMKIVKNASSNHYLVKSHLLLVISHLIRPHDIFPAFKEDESFYTDLHCITRDSKNPLLVKQAWKLLEESIYYHGGMIDKWKNSKILISFFELLNSKSVYVLIYALQTFYKIFDMADHESRRFEKGKYATRISERDSLKSMEKDLKLLASIFDEKFVFVKLNMIYQGSGKSESGMVFVNLAKMYNEIINNPICSKIYKKNIKKDEYKEGLAFFDDLITGFPDVPKKKKKKGLKPSYLSKGKIFQTPAKGKVAKKPKTPKKSKKTPKKKSSKKKSKKSKKKK
ncbi:sca1 complex scaffold protein scaa [Anaeramoeba flamelloides]|uniref:Sca1 complex scaffold protein scaa n=1 Tax=Anaeramoeba flamelloides TaxID=1746091 RepID=A0ABQ8YG13_9EUKA|nr:sca1 complex scaffold protein scaa [Anaeramoeba flamelloides]